MHDEGREVGDGRQPPCVGGARSGTTTHPRSRTFAWPPRQQTHAAEVLRMRSKEGIRNIIYVHLLRIHKTDKRAIPCTKVSSSLAQVILKAFTVITPRNHPTW